MDPLCNLNDNFSNYRAVCLLTLLRRRCFLCTWQSAMQLGLSPVFWGWHWWFLQAADQAWAGEQSCAEGIMNDAHFMGEEKKSHSPAEPGSDPRLWRLSGCPSPHWSLLHQSWCWKRVMGYDVLTQSSCQEPHVSLLGLRSLTQEVLFNFFFNGI